MPIVFLWVVSLLCWLLCKLAVASNLSVVFSSFYFGRFLNGNGGPDLQILYTLQNLS